MNDHHKKHYLWWLKQKCSRIAKHLIVYHQHIWKNDDSCCDPWEVKEDWYKLYPYGEKIRKVYCPRRVALLVEDASSNQKPSVHLHTHTCTHGPSQLRYKMRYCNIDQDCKMMLNNSTGTLHALGENTHPQKVCNKVGHRRHEKRIVIVPMPSLPEWDRWVKQLVPVPAYDVKDDDRYLRQVMKTGELTSGS